MKILFVILFMVFGCKLQSHKPIETIHCLIFEYTGEMNKPIPALIFCDSSKSTFNYKFYDRYVLENHILEELSHCVPKKTDTSKLIHYPLYKIITKSETDEKVAYITNPKELHVFSDCIEKYITEKDFHYAYLEIEKARKINPIQ